MANVQLSPILAQSLSNRNNKKMKKQPSLRTQRTLSKQSEFEEEDDIPLIETETVTSENVRSPSGVNVTVTTIGQQHREENKTGSGNAQRNRTHTKLKLLVRSHAMREATSPPPDPQSCSPTPLSHGTMLETGSNISDSPVSGITVVSNNDSLMKSPTGNLTDVSFSSSPNSNPEISNSIRRGDFARENSGNNNTTQMYGGPQLRNDNTTKRQHCVPTEINIEMASQTECDKIDCEQRNRQNSVKNHRTEINSSPNGNSQKPCPNMKAPNGRQIKNNSDGSIIISCPNCSTNEPECTNCSSHKNGERNINNNIASNNNNNLTSNNTLTVGRVNIRGKLKHQNSSQGSFDSSSASPCLSRDNSMEQYTDTTGINLTQFILETINKNTKDRSLLLKIESELVSFAKDKMRTSHCFNPMSSYQRMLVHRCAAFFGMDHNVESTGKCVIVTRTKGTRIPENKFRDFIRDDSEQRRSMSILKRDSGSLDESFKSPERQLSMENRRSKSFEEREEEYEKARRRIFNRDIQDASSQEELGWSEVPWSSSDSDNSSRMRLQPPDPMNYKSNRLLKVQSVETRDTLRPCVSKSFSFGGYTGATVSLLSRGDSVSSTHSAGARLLTKQDSATSQMSWRLSPSSSGYKSQSQRSDSVTPSPTATPYPPGQQCVSEVSSPPQQQNISWASCEPSNQPDSTVLHQPDHQHSLVQCSGNGDTPPIWNSHQSVMWSSHPPNMTVPPPNYQQIQGQNAQYQSHYAHQNERNEQSLTPQMEMPPSAPHSQSNDGSSQPHVMWAVTDLQSVPKGSVLIDPQTGQSFKNQDGSVYHFDPANPPPSLIQAANNQSPMKQHATPAKQSPSSKQPSCYSKQQSPPLKSQVTPQKQQQPSANYHQSPPSKQPSHSPPPIPTSQLNKPVQNKQMVPLKQSTPTKQSSVNLKIEPAQSPKKVQPKIKNNTKTLMKSGFTNSATSPSLPFTPPIQPTQFGAQGNGQNYQYLPTSQIENISNMPMQPYTMAYSNTSVYGAPNAVPIQDAGVVPAVPLYGNQTQMVYSYGVPMPPQYERVDNTVSDMSSYFMNMNIYGERQGAEITAPSTVSQPVTFQGPASYWGQQPMAFYVPPTPGNSQPNQRYSTMPLVQGQSGTYISAYPPATNYTSIAAPSIPPGAHTNPANTELVPVYTTPAAPIQMVYPGPPPAPQVSNPVVYAATNHPTSVVYAAPQNAPTPVYNQSVVYPSNGAQTNYPVTPNTPNSGYMASYAPPQYNDKTPMYVQSNSNRSSANTPKYQKNGARNTPNTCNSQSNCNNSNRSSVSSNSPASTVVQSYYPNTGVSGVMPYRHCSPSPATPPSLINTGAQGPPYGYSSVPGYGPAPHTMPPQSALVFRSGVQMGVRASPPMNPRSSRSPTPGLEHYERSNRYSMPPPMYQSVPCIIPGDVRYMSPRPQAPPYRGAYNRPPTFPPAASEATLGRPPKLKKSSRTKVTPPLPPSGR